MEWKELFDKVKVNIAELNKMNETYQRYERLLSGKLEEKDGDEPSVVADFVNTNNGIATIRNRSFRNKEREIINRKWDEVKNILKEIINKKQDNEKRQAYNKLSTFIKDNVVKKTEGEIADSIPHAATLRLAASVLPDYLCSIAAESDMNSLIDYLKSKGLIAKKKSDFKDAFSKSHFLLNTIKEEYEKLKPENAVKYGYRILVWRIREFFRGEDLTEIDRIIRFSKNVILTGAPGTGKTYLAKRLASFMVTGNDDFENLVDDDKLLLEKQSDFVQFHPSYDYTDFVEGLRPKQDTNSNTIVFQREDGIFKAFCQKAIEEINEAKNEKREPKPFVFIIDEINRGEISKIFGELFFAIDPGYRGEKGKVKTQYQSMEQSYPSSDPFKEYFYVPENVYIIGTMNDIDRNVESMDFAFRRRFAFYEITAESSQKMLTDLESTYKDITKRMKNLNAAIIDPKKGGLTEAYQLGGAYFKKIEDIKTIKNKKEDKYNKLWDIYLKGVLYEYFRGLPNDEIEKKIDLLKKAYDKDINETAAKVKETQVKETQVEKKINNPTVS